MRRSRRAAKIAGAILSILCLLSLCGPLIANDRPLILAYRGHLYVTVFQNLPGTLFGPNFLPSLADYQDPETEAAIHAHGWMIFPPIPYSYDTIVWNAPPAPAPPSTQNWLGTDSASRDVLARLIYGLRTSFLFGVCLTIAASTIGILAGAIQGFYGGMVDLLGQRFIEIWSGLPQLFIIITMASLILPGFGVLLAILLLFSWTTFTNRVRAEFLRARNLDFVRAAKSLGVSDFRIMQRHILPNALISILTFLPFILAESITLLASLDYLGFGLPPGTPSLGELIVEAQSNPQAPWIGITVFASLGGLLLILVMLGDFLRDALNPRNPK
jgi:microcin C transport system permease protein